MIGNAVNIVFTALLVKHFKKMICLSENMKFAEMFAEIKYVIFCLYFGSCYSVMNLLGTVLKFAGMGWGREGVSRERGGDREKNYNTGLKWGQFLKCGVRIGKNFCPHVIL